MKRYKDTDRHPEYERRKTAVMITDGDVNGRDLARFVNSLSDRVEHIEENVFELAGHFTRAMYGQPELNFNGVIDQLKELSAELKGLKTTLETTSEQVRDVRKTVLVFLLLSLVGFLIFAIIIIFR